MAAGYKHTEDDLRVMQSLPLDIKIRMTQSRIRGWVNEYGESGVYVSFSGGKDSTVLLHIVREMYPNIEAVFVNTGLEYPSIGLFARSKENVTTIRPEMSFREVILKYGYPLISKEVAECVSQARKGLESDKGYYSYRLAKLQGTAVDKEGRKSLYNQEKWKFLLYAPFAISHMCCNVMKKKPAKTFSKKYDKKPIIGTLADESRLRKQQWMKNGCNGFDMKAPVSNPLSFWVENDILQYIAENNLEIAKAYRRVVFSEKEGRYYTTGCQRTGCIFRLFGITQDRDRIARLQIEEPKLADYVLRGGEFGDSGYWQPSNNGLGYWFIIDWLNLHGLGIECYRDIDYAGIYGNERTRKILLSEKIKAGMKKMEVSDDCND